MAIKQGNTDASAIYLGSSEVTKVYAGATEIYSAAPASLISLADIQFYFPFDNTAVDESGNGNTLLETSTSFSTGKFGQALFVDANGNNDVILNSKVWGIANEFSVAAWVNASAFGSNRQIITADASFQGERVWQFRSLSNGRINFIRFDSGGAVRQCTTTTQMTTGSWIHVAATFSTTNGTKVYINGVESATESNLNPNANPSTPVAIGNGTSSSVGGPFDGSIDEAILYSRELTPTEISTLAAGTAPLIS